MRGITNAQGITGPDLNGILERLSLLENNPPVGSVTQFAGFDWVVAHWDTANSVMYMALKDIYSMTKFAETSSGVTYENSTLKQQLDDFASTLITGRNVGDSEAFNHRLAKVFVPTIEQLETEFAFLKIAISGKKNYAYSIANYQGQAVPWWTSTVADFSRQNPNLSDCAYCFEADGRYGVFYATTQTAGFRPFICIKMR